MGGEGGPWDLCIPFKLWCPRMLNSAGRYGEWNRHKVAILRARSSKAPNGEGDHHRGDSDDVHAAGRECHLNSAGEKYSVLGSNICTGTLPLVGCCRSQPNQPTKPLMNWKVVRAS